MAVLHIRKERRTLEIMLIVIVLGMTSLLHQMEGHKMVILNLFFLPVVLAGYFLGRACSGTLALFSAVTVTIVVALDSTGFAAYTSPVVVGLVVTVWAGVLGLTALLVGTLCDERSAKVAELHSAYVGVVEVLAKYLQSANPRAKGRSIRCAELSQAVAERMRLSQKEVDDIRVGALLYDMSNVEITTKLISKAVDTIEAQSSGNRHTFQGMELVHSLEPVLAGAVPLLMNQDDAVHDCLAAEQGERSDIPLGAKIIRAARAYDELTTDESSVPPMAPRQAVDALRRDTAANYPAELLRALERCVTESPTAATHDPRTAALQPV